MSSALKTQEYTNLSFAVGDRAGMGCVESGGEVLSGDLGKEMYTPPLALPISEGWCPTCHVI